MAVQAVKLPDPSDWVILDERGTERTGAAPATEVGEFDAPPTPGHRLHTTTPADGLKSRTPELSGRESPAEVPPPQPVETPSKSWFDYLCCYAQKV